MTTDTFEVEGVTLLDVPHARDLARECITEDVYQLRSLEGKWFVLDLGACFGEFTIWAASRGHDSLGLEPSLYSWRVAGKNLEFYVVKKLREENWKLNSRIICAKVGLHGKGETPVPHYFWENHPAGSGPKREDSTVNMVHELWIRAMLWSSHDAELKKFVKIDIEGDEVGLFEDPSWLEEVDALSMETHNHDADYFGGILEKYGFKVRLYGTCPQPLPPWDKSMTGGLVIARK